MREALTSYFEIEVGRNFIPKNFIAGVTTYNTMANIAVAINTIIAQMTRIMFQFQCYLPISGDCLLCNEVVVIWPCFDPRYRIKRFSYFHSG